MFGETSEKLFGPDKPRVNLLDPRKWSNTGRKEDVVDVNAGNKANTLGSSTGALCERLGNHGCSYEHRASHDVASNKRDSSTDFIEEKDTDDLADDTHRIVDTVDKKGVFLEADFCVDSSGVVLDSADTGHLNRKLQNNTVKDLSEICLVLEDLRSISQARQVERWTNQSPTTIHGSFLLYFGQHLLVLSLNELVVDVASRVESSERLESVFRSAFDHEPSELSVWIIYGLSIQHTLAIPGTRKSRRREEERGTFAKRAKCISNAWSSR
jgi:hypothetical protein